MKVTVRYFAQAREAAGVDGETVELPPDGARVEDLLALLGGRSGPLGEFVRLRPLLCAVNGEYAPRDGAVREGDEVALFPPVSGG